MPINGIDASGGFAASPTKASAARPADRSFRTLLAEETTKAGTTTASAEAAKPEAAKPKTPKGEKTEAVEGHAYSEITAGPRNGMFLNTSGNTRDGLAFTLVERDGFHFHIYGTGDDRKIFRVKEDDDTSTSGGTAAAAKP